MELTIDEFARRVGMTGRSVRQWQTFGLLPTPLRRGRTAIYTQDHLARIERIKTLRDQGFPLDLIRRVLDRQDAAAEADVLRIASDVLTPVSTTDRIRVSATELTTRLGADAISALLAANLARHAGPELYELDQPVLAVFIRAREAGLSVPALADAWSRAAHHHSMIAAILVDAALTEVWRPFLESGLQPEGWHKLALEVERLKEVGLEAAAIMSRQAIDAAVNEVLPKEATVLLASLADGDPV